MNIEEDIPHPVLQKVSGTTLGKPWYKRIWLYFTEPTVQKFVEDWKIKLPNGMRIMIPADTETDGASIPWFLRFLATSFGPLSRGAYPHDFGFKHGYFLDWDGNRFAIGRDQKFFDDIFRDIIIWTTGLKSLAAWAWSGVRTFGFIAWDKHRRND